MSRLEKLMKKVSQFQADGKARVFAYLSLLTLIAGDTMFAEDYLRPSGIWFSWLVLAAVSLAGAAKAEVGKIYTGKVVKIMEFGAFVNFLGKQDGLVHISELAAKRVEKVSDVVKEGDEVKVKVLGFDKGKVKLSIKQALDS